MSPLLRSTVPLLRPKSCILAWFLAAVRTIPSDPGPWLSLTASSCFEVCALFDLQHFRAEAPSPPKLGYFVSDCHQQWCFFVAAMRQSQVLATLALSEDDNAQGPQRLTPPSGRPVLRNRYPRILPDPGAVYGLQGR